jgi:N-glycosylase/DNA lyase|tara:strand:- start:5722 stop:5997 length:276 start_codon:yes stop_codon:yes gene_type:complete
MEENVMLKNLQLNPDWERPENYDLQTVDLCDQFSQVELRLIVGALENFIVDIQKDLDENKYRKTKVFKVKMIMQNIEYVKDKFRENYNMYF